MGLIKPLYEVVEPERPRGVWGRPSPQYKMKKSLADGPSGSEFRVFEGNAPQ